MDASRTGTGPALDTNRMKANLASGGFAFGTIIASARTPEVVRLAGAASLDYVWLDQQHAPLSDALVADMCLVARAIGITPIVRPTPVAPDLERLFDIGAMGLVLSDVTSRAQVDHALEALRRRPNTVTAAGYAELSTETDEAIVAERLLEIQIESREGIDALPDLLGGGGVDVVQIGRNDMAQSLGVPRQLRHDRVLAAVDQIVAIAREHGAAVAAGAYSEADVEDLMGRGVRCFHYLTDTELLLKAYQTGRAMLADRAARLT